LINDNTLISCKRTEISVIEKGKTKKKQKSDSNTYGFCGNQNAL